MELHLADGAIPQAAQHVIQACQVQMVLQALPQAFLHQGMVRVRGRQGEELRPPGKRCTHRGCLPPGRTPSIRALAAL